LKSAREIYQTNLDQVSRALWDRKFTRILEHISIPNMTLTNTTEIIFASEEEFFVNLSEFRERLDQIGTVQFRRYCFEAVFAGSRSDVIMGRHETFLYDDKGRVFENYINQMTMLKSPAGWRAIRIESMADNDKLAVLPVDMAEQQKREFEKLSGTASD